jgi:aspartyl protease family protein
VTDPDQALNLVYLFACLVLVASALIVRRLPLGHGLKMAGAWLAIFAVLFLIFAAKDELVSTAKALFGQGETAAKAGPEIRIRKSDDGHFWINGRVDGVAARFLVDSGATVTSISKATADRASIDYSEGFPVMVDTANGLATMRRGRVARLEIGQIARTDFPVQVSEGDNGVEVLGMNFLSSLRSWGVEGQYLVLRT